MVELNIVFGSADMWELEKGKTTKRQLEWSRDSSGSLGNFWFF